MRILAAFLSVLFLFINPTMIVKVTRDFECVLLGDSPMSAPSMAGCGASHANATALASLRPAALRWLAATLAPAHADGSLQLLTNVTLILTTLVHALLTGFHIYGIYSCRPAFVRPMLADAACSLGYLTVFVFFNVLLLLHANAARLPAGAGSTLRAPHQKAVYVGAAFLVTYALWMAVNVSAYVDVNKLHADFMYWIVEERTSMRRGSLRLSTDNRSERSSKSSKMSKNSTRSTKSEHSRPNSAAASIPSKKTSLANNRLSVPL